MTQKLKVYVLLQVVFSCFSGAALFSIYIIDGTDEPVYVTYSLIVASVFWISVISKWIFVLLASYCRKKNFKKYSFSKKRVSFGIISFFKTKIGIVFDILLMLSVIAFLIMLICEMNKIWQIIPVLTVLYTSLNLHSIFNGINYRILLKLMGEKKL